MEKSEGMLAPYHITKEPSQGRKQKKIFLMYPPLEKVYEEKANKKKK